MTDPASDPAPSAPSEGSAVRVVDAVGQACPLPVIRLAKAVGEMEVGEEVAVLADDPGAKVDIPVWCRMRRQDYLGAEEHEPGWRFTIRKVE